MRLFYRTAFVFFCFPVILLAQVDTSYVYNPSAPYGALDIRLSKWSGQYYYLREDTTFSFRESSPGVKTNTYQDMTSWDSSPFKQGHMRDKNGAIDNFVMNYRMMHPLGYNASFSPGYPMIVMMHGAGERGNCWDNNCFFSTTSWSPVTNVPAAPTTVDHQLLNNDYNLLHGGLPHLNAVNLAGTKLPDDPTLATRAFPGFVLFPQNLNGWGANPAQDVIRLVRLLCKKYNIDENRIYIHGLSNGGMGTYDVIKRAPWLFAAALPMSAIHDAEIVLKNQQAEVGKVPLWIFQGGQDTNPTPTETFTLVKKFREAGAVVRYYNYPSLGHGTWNTAYNEPDFFTWMLANRKYNPHIFFGNPYICGPSQVGVKMGFSKGFLGYQWERDGSIIPGATEAEYTATIPGTYRARFSRIQNPGEAQWERWSDPIVVTELNPAKPVIEVTGSTHLRGPGQANVDANNTVILKSQNTAEIYKWYFKGTMNADGTPGSFAPVLISSDTVRNLTLIKNNNLSVGTYTLVTDNANCPSQPADSVYLFFNNQPGTANIPAVGTNINTLGINFKGIAMSPTSILLSWNDKVNNEKGYQIWRRKGPVSPTEFKFVGRTGEDGISFLDTNLEANTSYEYKLRAINNTGRSNYIPGNFDADLVNNYQISTPPDSYAPGAPQNLAFVSNTGSSISLSWQAATDDGGIKEYYVYYGTDSVSTGAPVTTFTLSGIAPSTTFLIRVKAVDFANRFSPASNQIVATTYISGLTYKHSTGAWTDLDDPTMVAKFTNPEFTGTINNFSLTPRTQEDFFNFQYLGSLYITNAGSYQFRTTSDDGSRLTLNNAIIVDNDGAHGSITVTSSNLTLSQGTHSIDVKFFEYNGGQSLTVQYKGPDTGNVWVNIPDAALQNAPYIPGSPAGLASPVNLTASGVNTQQINLSWQPGAPENINGLKIVVLGSSTAVGTGASPVSNSFVELLKSYFTGEQVINLAVNGYTTRHIMPTGSPSPATPATASNITAALAQRPHLIIINLPTNDVNNNITNTETMANYRAVKALADSYGVKLLVTTTQPRNFSTSSLRTLLDTQGDSIRNLFGANTIDIYDELTDFSNSRRIKTIYSSGDGIHLNNAGHNYIYLTARAKIQEYVQQLSLSPKYEVFRSQASSGPYSIIKTTAATSHVDNDPALTPGSVFYYKVRTLYTSGGLSDFSNTASDTTFADPTAPTTPAGLQLISKTFTNIAFSWTASTDNIAVAGYDVFANGILIGTSPVHSYTASDLQPNTSYTFTVKAFDAQGNRSAESASLAVITNTPATYYSVSGGNLNTLTTWKQNADGTGNSPSSFGANGQYFVVNNTATSLGGPWNISGLVSKVIVPSGVTLTVDNEFSAKVDVEGTGTLNLDYATAPEILSISPTSTINFNTYSTIPKNIYGNVNLNGTGNKTFSEDTTTILGNLTVANGSILKGAADNATVLKIAGNITVNGGTDITAADNRINLYCAGTGTQNLSTNGNLYLYKIETSAASNLNITNAGTPATFYIGSLKGGGLKIANGSTLDVANNNLEFEYAATINTNNETGKIGINGGSINITSSSSNNSNLYFSASNNVINRFGINLSGTGDVFFRELAQITDALKITRGEIVAGGNITLTSTELKTANIEEIENGGVITGDVNVQRYFNPKGRVYRYLSTPVANTSIADWQANFPVTGAFTGTSTGPGLSASPSIYHYDESNGGWLPYPPPGSNNQVLLDRAKGYSVFMRNASAPITSQVAGNPYQGNIPFVLDGGTGGDDGWNLVGNPYASTIVWSNNAEDWIKSGINPVISVKDNPSGQYRYYDAENNVGDLTAGKIAPGQGFWVKAVTATPALTITEKAKISDQQTFYREAAPATEHLVVNLVQGSKADPAYILFTEQGTDNFDNHVDGMKQPNEGMFNLSSRVTGNIDLAVNNLGNSFCTKTVRLNIANATAGSYKLTFDNLETLKGVGQITLTDHFAETVTVINDDEYSFAISSDARSAGPERFSLTFTRPSLTLTAEPVAAEACGSDYAIIKLRNTQTEVDYAIINDAGQLISDIVTAKDNQAELHVHQSKLQAGLNSFKVKAGFKGCESSLLPVAATVRYTEPFAVSAQDFLSVCQGTSPTLTASGAPNQGYYKWFNKDGYEIATTQTGSLQVAAVRSETAYFVSAVHPGGCESQRKAIHIFPETLDTPALTFSEGVLYTDAIYGLQWKKDGELIQDAKSLTFKPVVSGFYTVETYNGGCVKESLPFEYLVTGSELAHNTGFHVDVYPMPASSHNIHVKITSEVDAPAELDLVDPLGKNHYNRTYESAEIKGAIKVVPLDLPDGFYFVIVKQGNKILKKKIVIKN